MNSQKTSPYDADLPEYLLSSIGLRLILLQNLETHIDFVAKAVFSENIEDAKRALLKADPKTMGQLLGMLRRRVTIDDDFDDCLKRTLKARNLFVHEFSVKYDLHTNTGIIQAAQFICNTMDDLEKVTNVMSALIYSFGKERGVSAPQLESDWRKHGNLNDLENIHIPKLKDIFEKK